MDTQTLALEVVELGTNFLTGTITGRDLDKILGIEIFIPGILDGEAQLRVSGAGTELDFFLTTTLTAQDLMGPFPQYQLLLRTEEKKSCQRPPLILTGLIVSSKAACEDVVLSGGGTGGDFIMKWANVQGVSPIITPIVASFGFNGLLYAGVQGLIRGFDILFVLAFEPDIAPILEANGVFFEQFVKISPTEFALSGTLPDNGEVVSLQVRMPLLTVGFPIPFARFGGCVSALTPSLIPEKSLLKHKSSSQSSAILATSSSVHASVPLRLLHCTPGIAGWNRFPIVGEKATIGRGEQACGFRLDTICGVNIVSEEAKQGDRGVPVNNLIITPTELLFQIPPTFPIGPAFYLLRSCTCPHFIPIVLGIVVTPPEPTNTNTTHEYKHSPHG